MPVPGELPDGRVPVSVLTGFLGSGKTTLLKRLLRSPDMSDTAVVINEFGEIGIDDLLVTEIANELFLLESGCVCCQVMGDLVDALKNLIARREEGEIPRFSRILLETTGLADPAPVLKTLIDDPALGILVAPGVVIATVDGVLGLKQIEEHPETVRQVVLADRLVITKPDLASPSELDLLEARLRDFNPAVRVFVASFGEVSADELLAPGALQSDGRDPREVLVEAQAFLASIASPRHSEGVSTFSVEREAPVNFAALGRFLRETSTELSGKLLRVKGIVNALRREKPLVIQGVGGVLYPITFLEKWPDGPRKTRLVMIVWQMSDAEVARLKNDLVAALQS
jgi:G3E family GTPase